MGLPWGRYYRFNSCLCVTRFLFFSSFSILQHKWHKFIMSQWSKMWSLLCFQKACLKRRSWLMIFVRSKVEFPPESERHQNVIICSLTWKFHCCCYCFMFCEKFLLFYFLTILLTWNNHFIFTEITFTAVYLCRTKTKSWVGALSIWGRSPGDRSGRRDESHPGCSHWLLRLYKYKQMEYTGTEQAETPWEGHGQAGKHGDERRKTSWEAPWTHQLSLQDRTR